MASITICDWSGCKVGGSVRPNRDASGELQRVNGPVIVPPRPALSPIETDEQKERRLNQPRSMRVLFTVCHVHAEDAADWLAKHRTVQGAFADIDATQLAGDAASRPGGARHASVEARHAPVKAPKDDGNGGEAS